MAKDLSKIDRGSPIPYYVQVVESLKDYVQSNSLQPGDKLPSEMDLCQRFDVSRTVIRQALQSMESAGLIVRSKGRGAFVAESKINESLVQKLTGFHQDMSTRGYDTTSDVLQQAVVPVDSKIAEYLELEPGAPVIKITRLRMIDGEPIVLVTTYLPHQYCRGVEHEDLREQSLYEILESKYALSLARGERLISAVTANAYEADLLNIREGAPLVTLESVSYLSDDTPIEFYHALHRADRSQFQVELVRFRETAENRTPLSKRSPAFPASH